jgi:hypothetical protein
MNEFFEKDNFVHDIVRDLCEQNIGLERYLQGFMNTIYSPGEDESKVWRYERAMLYLQSVPLSTSQRECCLEFIRDNLF